MKNLTFCITINGSEGYYHELISILVQKRIDLNLGDIHHILKDHLRRTKYKLRKSIGTLKIMST